MAEQEGLEPPTLSGSRFQGGVFIQPGLLPFMRSVCSLQGPIFVSAGACNAPLQFFYAHRSSPRFAHLDFRYFIEFSILPYVDMGALCQSLAKGVFSLWWRRAMRARGC
jgi:hypothetical protein